MTETIDLTTLAPHRKLLRVDVLLAEYMLGWQWIGVDFYDVSTLQHQFWLLASAEDGERLRPGEWVWYEEEDKAGRPQGNRVLATNLLTRYTQDLASIYALVVDTFDLVDITTQKYGRSIRRSITLHSNDKAHAEYATERHSLSVALCLALLEAYQLEVIL